MPFNGSGVFVVSSTGQPVVAATLITAAVHNALTVDLATGLSTAILKDGTQAVTANVPFGGFKLTGVGAATARTDAASLASIQDGTGVYVATVGGTADAITLTALPAITAYAAGQTFRFIASGANTTAVTVAINGLTAKAITKNGTTALAAGDIASASMACITYDGTRFILASTNTAILNSPTLVSPVFSTALDCPDNLFRVVGSSDATKKAALEVDGLTTGTTRTLTVQDENGTLALTNEFAYSNIAGSLGRMPYPTMWMQGFTFSNNVGDATNDLDIAAGSCRDATDAHNIIGAALTKRSDATFVVGTNQGMLDTGVVDNSDYYLWAIKRSDTGVTDILSSLSSTAPSMPANYDFTRLIGWFKRVGGTVVAFNTYEIEGGGLELLWTIPTLDITQTNTLTTTRQTNAVKVPLNFSVIAELNVAIVDASAIVIIYCPDQSDGTPSVTAAPLANISGITSLSGTHFMMIRTSATGTIAARATTTVDTYSVSTIGFLWARRN